MGIYLLPSDLDVFTWLGKNDGVEVTQTDLISHYDEWRTKNFVPIYVCFSVVGGYIGIIPFSMDEIKFWAKSNDEKIFEWYLIQRSCLMHESGLTNELIESIVYK